MEFINNITLHSNLFCRQFLHLFSRRLRYFLQFLFLLFHLFDFLVHFFLTFSDFLPQSLKFLRLLLYYSRLYLEKKTNIEIYNIMNYYRPQTKFAKVMFSQVSVCPRGCLSEGCLPPPGQTPSPGQTVNKRVVRIALECNLVIYFVLQCSRISVKQVSEKGVSVKGVSVKWVSVTGVSEKGVSVKDVFVKGLCNGVSVKGGLCERGSLLKGVSVKEVFVKGNFENGGLCIGVSLKGATL